ncbi:ferritin-like domain-containing protein [Rhodobacter sp. 24-YEA-8]|uniref:YciE/YciF ferroxidase family protein n=1 Tax=Rhodobacter sp. 24-YEA-8 TaxID=1884310 RepID=UPI000896B814|nr:ferritin-like domain-containing protein [Rhodobacter sp. 24-YEA-8]SED49847.1 Ferritin-like metal-binding protein YciE [Rhodobacter sp. 24-YEA-8]
MKAKTLDDLFLDLLKDVYYAERKVLKALPKMARAAQSAELGTAFEKHHDETQIHVERLQQVFEILGKPARGKTCPAIEGILDEGEEVIESFKGSPALDAGLIAAAQAVEHYEMARYGTLRNWAELLGQDEIAKILQNTLTEEEATDSTLTELADGYVNKAALAAA